MTEQKQQEEFDVIDLRQLFGVLKKWRRVIAGITALAVITSALMSYFVIAPVYEARAMLVVTMPADNQRVAVQSEEDLESVINAVSRLPYMTMNTYVSQLTSDTMYERVVKRLELDGMGYSAKNLANMVKAEVAKDSNVIQLKVQHTNPRLAADVANTLSEEYLQYLSERNQQQMTRSTEFLQAQKEETEKELARALEDLESFNADPRSVEYLQKQVESITADINKYRTEIDLAEMELKQLAAGIQSMSETLAGTPEKITVSRAEPGLEGAVSAEELNPAYTGLYDRLITKQSEHAEKAARVEAMKAVVNRLQLELETLQAELSVKQIEQQQKLSEIQRLEETRNLLAQKVTQTQIARSIDLGDTRLQIASPALVPSSPVKPNKKLNIALALVLGLMLSVALTFVLELLDNTIKQPEDVEKHLELPVLGVIPANRDGGRPARRWLLRGGA